MNFIEQFTASFTFQFKKVAEYRYQSIWKTILYLFLIIVLAGSIRGVFAMTRPGSLAESLEYLPEPFLISQQGMTELETAIEIELHAIETLVIIGNMTGTRHHPSLVNVVNLNAEGWSIGRLGSPLYEAAYAAFPLFPEGAAQLDRAEVLELAYHLDEQLRFFAPFYHYFSTVVDLVVHLALISFFALGGLGFKKMIAITYKQLWNLTAYGATAPLMIRTFLRLLGMWSPTFLMFYWLAIGFFAIGAVKKGIMETEK